ncbi:MULTISPECIES: terminase small subunit [unclassified Paraburkholderia]|uniref:terminase small subunit n=1 Tax=unclassified Paraburkholderia TaxID=2615204 RepID=UPI002AB2F28B|nr:MULTISPECIES: terminase small subunit [unclassified Paraburkholderia]
MADRELTPREQRFCEEYLVDLSQANAAHRAGYSKNGARQTGYNLMQRPAVCAEINRLMAERSERVRVTADEVLNELTAVMRADASEIAEIWRCCCRYCWGAGHAYQFKTLRELEDARRRHAIDLKRARAAKVPKAALPVFDESGGVGFNANREPCPDCPECEGYGFERVRLRDTRTLVGDAKRLFDGVKQTKEGVETKVRDRTKAAELIGRHLGMFNDKLELTRPKVRVKDLTGRRKVDNAGTK